MDSVARESGLAAGTKGELARFDVSLDTPTLPLCGLLERSDERGPYTTIGNRECTEERDETGGDANQGRPMHTARSKQIVHHDVNGNPMKTETWMTRASGPGPGVKSGRTRATAGPSIAIEASSISRLCTSERRRQYSAVATKVEKITKDAKSVHTTARTTFTSKAVSLDKTFALTCAGNPRTATKLTPTSATATNPPRIPRRR